jgi:putative ABC transport system permease protein
VTLEMRRDDGSLGTGTFAVAAIFDEPGFFGYAAYADAEGLNGALGRPEGARTDVAVFLGPGMSRADATERLRTSLGELAPTFPALDSKATLGALWRKGIDRETFSVISLDANLAEIRDFVDALRAVTLAALAVFLVVIAAGVLSTYRIVVRERTGEIGTMRAMGMSRAGVASTFFWEAVGVSALGCAAGFAAGLGLSALASTLDLSRYAPLAMLLVDGRPSPAWDPLALAASFGIVCACAVLAATGPAWKTASLEPATALQGAKR